MPIFHDQKCAALKPFVDVLQDIDSIMHINDDDLGGCADEYLRDK